MSLRLSCLALMIQMQLLKRVANEEIGMKIQYAWHTFNIAEAISTLVPFKSKKYVKKFGKVCPDDMSNVYIKHDCQNNLKATIVQYCDITTHVMDMPKPIYAYGISMRDLWDNMLEALAKHKNMRNAEELCIWLDMQDV